jgi:uncharacterized protein (TIRG00374 family)
LCYVPSIHAHAAPRIRHSVRIAAPEVIVKKIALRVLRIVVSVGLLVWVFLHADVGTLVERLSGAHWGWLAAAFFVNLSGNLFGAWRWRLLLQGQGRDVPPTYLFGSYLIGLFFNNFLPSTIGGDVVRAASAKKKGGGTLTENLTVVLVERMIGLLATLTLGGVAAVTGEAGRLDPRITWALGGALVVSFAGLYLALSSRVRRRALRWIERIPIAFVRRTLGKMLAAFELFGKARGVLLGNYVLSLAFQFLLIVHYWVIQFAFGEHVPLLTFVVIVPLVFCVMMLPIGINGLGVRESAFVWFLSRAGMEPATALALSLASYAIAVVQGLAGGVLHLVREFRERKEASSQLSA